MISVKTISLIAALVAVAASAANRPAQAQASGSQSLALEYDEASDTYFELRVATGSGYANVNWSEAAKHASRLRKDGRIGRLAVIDTPEKHEFAVRHLLPARENKEGLAASIWIGLRYWCQFRSMMWSTGEVHEHQDFGIWGRPWHYGGEDPCRSGRQPYVGVYYTDANFWQAISHQKRFRHFLVEYPSADEAPAASAATDNENGAGG